MFLATFLSHSQIRENNVPLIRWERDRAYPDSLVTMLHNDDGIFNPFFEERRYKAASELGMRAIYLAQNSRE